MAVGIATQRLEVSRDVEQLVEQLVDWALDSKSPSGADIPFKVTMDGHGLPWTELNATQTYRVLGLYFTGEDSFLQIYGNQGAVTKAFPTNH
ncbi:MAG: hypothetical protein WAZ77_23240 [Candidatus Nitrosopolaris sp.]|jgi:hypothetical protein